MGLTSERILTIWTSAAFDAIFVTALVLIALLPARWMARLTRRAQEAWLIVLVAAALLVALVIALGVVERWLSSPSVPRIAVLAIGSGGLGLVIGGIAMALGWSGRIVSLRVATIMAVVALVVATGLAGFGAPHSTAGSAPPPDRPNLVLISIDTLRADHLGAYGYDRNTSPNLDALALRGTLFETTVVHSNWTLPSHATLFTGLDPFAHGAFGVNSKLAKEHLTLAERLQAAGYRTAAWVGMRPHSYVGAERNFDQGFGSYLHIPHARRFRQGLIARLVDQLVGVFVYRGVGEAGAQVDALLRFLQADHELPFFAFLHLYDTHSRSSGLPYASPRPFLDQFCGDELEGYDGCDTSGACATEHLLRMNAGSEAQPDTRKKDALVCLYDGAIAYVDHELGRIFSLLDRAPFAGRTVIVVTSDHGENFYERGRGGHSFLYEETARVPLIIVAPDGVPGIRVAGVARGVDLLPTILELLGLPLGGTIQGSSLAQVIRAGRVVKESLPVNSLGRYPNEIRTLRTREFKYIQNRPLPGDRFGRASEELYDLGRDPHEQHNLARLRPERLAELRAAMAAREAKSTAILKSLLNGEVEKILVPEAEAARLRSLGYVE
jgi:arylsulfatase A-like enzyme